MNHNGVRILVLLGLITSLGVSATSSAQGTPRRSITPITGDLYRGQNNNHFTVFLVTDEGIILTDPINTGFATWLKSELDSRFDVPVRYVLYSHHHGDHASGGDVFADTAQFVGHENMLSHLAMPPESTPLPIEGQYAIAATMDANGNGRIERSEASGAILNNFSGFDANGDGELSGAEVLRGPLSAVRPPDITYSTTTVISLGGKQVEMTWVGEMNHSMDMSVITFPAERAMHIVDFITFQRLPYREMDFENGLFDEWMSAIKHWESLADDYDYISPGHGPVGDITDVREWRRYFEKLRDAVADGIDAGQSLEEMRANIEIEEYSEWEGYSWLDENVLGMYHFLTDDDDS
ncbi:MAG: MBL fold metallo-hydrolase [Gammaproteobacteria bacterium]|nr:MAG: MBL fold metallo-hydrolase [Gammaproteobacteria bacterium]